MNLLRSTRAPRSSPALLVLAACALIRTASAQSFTLLGFLPGGTSSVALAVSGDGHVVVGQSSSADGQRAFRWSATTGMTNLGTLSGSYESEARGTNDDGSVVVGDSLRSTYGYAAFQWTSATGILPVDAQSACGQSVAAAVSGDGSVIAGSCWSPAGGHGSQWVFSATGIATQNLSPFPGRGYANSRAISRNGQVVVGDSGNYGDSTLRAALWTGSQLVNLGTLPGDTLSEAHAVNRPGTVVVGTSYSPTYTRTFRWTAASGMQPLPFPRSSAQFTGGISDTGTTIVGSTVPPLQRAILWRPGIGAVDLNTYLPSLGVDLGDWVLTYAFGISADGRTVVGTAYNFGTSVTQAWLATLPPACDADFNADGHLSVQDMFDFINAWFTTGPIGDFNASGAVTMQDIFDFLNAWLAGC